MRERPSRLILMIALTIAAGSALSLAARAGETPARDDPAAKAAGPKSGADAPGILAPEEVKAGMKGFGLTVFSGTDPERSRAVSRNESPDGA